MSHELRALTVAWGGVEWSGEWVVSRRAKAQHPVALSRRGGRERYVSCG